MDDYGHCLTCGHLYCTCTNEQGEREIKSIGALLPKIERRKKTAGGVNSAFNNAVSFVVELMGEQKDPKRFGYWCGRLRKVPVQEIHALLSKAKEGNKPRALFNWLLDEYKKKQKKLSTQSLDTTP